MQDVFIKKYWAEEDVTFYLHFKGQHAARQIEVSKEGTLFLSADNPEEHKVMDDQALATHDFEPSDMIPQQEFEEIWNGR